MPGRRGTARCRRDGCGAPIVFFRSPFTGNVRAFDETPVDGRHALAVKAFPVLGRTAYKFAPLVELIQVQRECTDVEAEAEVRDMPWHFLHDCAGDNPSASTTHHQPVDEPEKEATRP